MDKKYATIYDVADHAKVSIATVSRVLTGSAPVRTDTRERVEAAIEELNFVPNSVARSLSGGRCGVIALVYPLDLERTGTDPLREDNASVLYADAIIRGATWQAALHGYLLFACAIQVEKKQEATAVTRIARVADAIILTDRAVSSVRSMRAGTRARTVLLSASATTKFGGAINIDNVQGISDIVEHMRAEHNVTRFGFVGGIPDSYDAKIRYEAFTKSVAEHGGTVDERDVLCGYFSLTRAENAIYDRMKDSSPLPDVFVCANDQMAVGVTRALIHHGVRVPEDVAVTGFDDMPLASHVQPSLTTVAQPAFDLGVAAVEMVIGILDGTRTTGTRETVPTHLIRRESCGCHVSKDTSVTTWPASSVAGMSATAGDDVVLSPTEMGVLS